MNKQRVVNFTTENCSRRFLLSGRSASQDRVKNACSPIGHFYL